MGRKGWVKASGSLPLKVTPETIEAKVPPHDKAKGELQGMVGGDITLEAQGLEMRVKSSYSGAMDARVNLKGVDHRPSSSYHHDSSHMHTAYA